MQRPVLSPASGSTPKVAPPGGIDESAKAAAVNTGGFGGVVVPLNVPPSKRPPVVLLQHAGCPAPPHEEVGQLHMIGVVWVGLVRQPEGFAALLPQSKVNPAKLLNPMLPSVSRK